MARPKGQGPDPEAEAAGEAPDDKDPRRIKYRWAEGPAEWALLANGLYQPLRYGDITLECTVRPRRGDTRKRGTVVALAAGYGYPLRVQVWVDWGPPATQPGWKPDPRSKIEGPMTVYRWWPAEELEAVKR